MTVYSVLVSAAAERERRRLSPDVRMRVNQALIRLEDEPRPKGVTKLSGSLDRWRIRVGDYRIIYAIDDGERVLTILRIAHRRDAYR